MTLKEIRKNRKLSQADVAEAVGVSQRAIMDYEYGLRAPSTRTLLRLIKLYNDPIGVIEAVKTSIEKKGGLI